MPVSRRLALTRTAALAAAASSGLVLPARAQARQVIVGTWGGDGAETLRKVVDTPLQAKGLEVLQEIATGDPRLTKMLVERASRRGSFDVAHLSDSDKHLAASQGVLDALPAARIPRMQKVLPAFQEADAIPFVYSFRAILYNDRRVDAPPKSYADLWDPKWQGKIGVADQFYLQVVESAAMATGAGVSNFEPAKKMLLDWRKMGVRVYPSHEAVAAALKSEEILLTIGLASRAVFWRRGGVPVKFVLPREGGTTLVYKAMVPKNARNKDEAWTYLDAMLQPEAQAGLSRTMCCLPVVSDVPLPAELVESLTISEQDRSRLVSSDFAYMLKAKAEYLEFWQKQFRA